MPKQVRFRRGTTTQHATFTGAEGEVTVDVTKKTAVVHDGATAGGYPLAQEEAVTGIDVLSGNPLWVDAVNGSDAPASIDAAGPVNVRLYGTIMANLAKSDNVTFITGATRFEVDSDVG